MGIGRRGGNFLPDVLVARGVDTIVAALDAIKRKALAIRRRIQAPCSRRAGLNRRENAQIDVNFMVKRR